MGSMIINPLYTENRQGPLFIAHVDLAIRVKSWMDPSCRKSLGFDPIPLGSLGSIFEATKIHDPQPRIIKNQQNRLPSLKLT